MRRPSHATVVAYLALFIAVSGAGGAAYAATGGTFILGKSNSAGAVSTLTRTTSGPALSLRVPSGAAPLAVNSSSKVANLNADRLDGLDSSQFQRTLPNRLTFTALTPAAGWFGNCFAGAPGIAVDAQGVVRLRGDMCAATGAGVQMTTIPAAYRPTQTLYLTADMCNATTGRIIIYTDGTVYVEADPSSTPAESYECFVSLAGISFTLPY